MIGDERSDERVLATAARYLELRDPRRVLEQLGQLTAEGAAGEHAVVLRAFAHIADEDPGRAAEVARDALIDHPQSVAVLFALSRALEEQGDLPRAELAILDALAIDPDDHELLAQYADLTMRDGQLDKAQRLLERAEAGTPESAAVGQGRLRLAYLRGDDREVKRRSEALLTLDPENAAAQSMLGFLDFRRGDTTTAGERFSGIVAVDPHNQAAAEVAREARRFSGVFGLPQRLLLRFGVIGTWVGAMVLIFGLRAAGLDTAAGAATVVWLAFCASTWLRRS